MTTRHQRALDAPQRPIAAALDLPTDHVHAIVESHERCLSLGLTRFDEPDLSALARADLTLARERNQRLHAHAAPVMEMLFEQIVQTQSMVVLCDATGTIIHSVGDDDFLSRARKVALAPGVNWSEQAKGTNAIGTALVAEAPTLVHADEHFMQANHFLTCSAAPILDPRGNVLGVLDVTGDRHSYHQHTMALVRMSARMIENHWLSDDYRDVLRLHFHGRAEFIGTLMEGILAITPDGRIVGANRSALDQLALSGAALRRHTLPTLLGTSVGALVEHFRSPLATPLIARTVGDRPLYMVARFDWPAGFGAVPAAAAVAAVALPPPAAPAETAGLAALSCGDAQMDAVAAKVRRVIDHDLPILIVGETGTGKERLARAIHAESRRAQRRFIVVNCASMPDLPGQAGLLEQIAQADGGTLFLDDIGEMPAALQAQLLRVLPQRRDLAAGHHPARSSNMAVICASHQDLRASIAARAFREDLYYRLNGLALRLPPLRERSDLLALARRIVEREARPRAMVLSPEVASLLAHCPWPGNVRQLSNVLRAACALAASEQVLRREHLPDDLLDEWRAYERSQAATPAPQVVAPAASPAAVPPRSLDDIELDAIRRAVDAAQGNISEAAKRLGISRNTIYRKLRWKRSVQ